VVFIVLISSIAVKAKMQENRGKVTKSNEMIGGWKDLQEKMKRAKYVYLC